MLQINLAKIAEADICVQSGQRDDSITQCIRHMTGLKKLTDRTDENLAKHMDSLQSALESLAIPRTFVSTAEPLSKLFAIGQANPGLPRPEKTIITVNQLLLDVTVPGL